MGIKFFFIDLKRSLHILLNIFYQPIFMAPFLYCAFSIYQSNFLKYLYGPTDVKVFDNFPHEIISKLWFSQQSCMDVKVGP